MPKKSITKVSKRIWGRWPLVTRLSVLYALVSLATFIFVRHNINPDALSYISIAEKYADFNFKEAINGYWGPLTSLLLVPLLWLGAEPLAGLHLVQYGAGLAVIVAANQFFGLCGLKKWQQALALSATTLLAWFWASSTLTPDLILLALALWATSIVFTVSADMTHKALFITGAVGAALYATKTFGLIFFCLLLAIKFIVATKRNVRRNLVIIGCVTGLLILPFVVAISLKYNQVTLGTSAEYNRRIVGGSEITFPFETSGLVAPPNSGAYSVWEDPIIQTPYDRWQELGAKEKLGDHAELLKRNITLASSSIAGYGYLMFAAILLVSHVALFNLFERRRKLSELTFLELTTAAAAGMVLVYSYLWIEERYIWYAVVMGVGAAALILPTVFKKLGTKQLTNLLVVIMVLLPIGFTILDRAPSSIQQSDELRHLSERVRDQLPAEPRVASNEFESLYACYYWQVQCFGILLPIDPGQVEDYEINTFVLYKFSDNKIDVSSFKKLGETTNYAIYRVN